MLLYFNGIRDLSKIGTHRSLLAWHSIAFGSALALLVLVLESPLDAWANRLLWVHMLQHEALIAAVAPLLLLGAPLLPLLHGVPLSFRRWVFGLAAGAAPVRRSVSATTRVMSAPWLAWILFVLMLTVWHIPPVYDLALRRPPVHELEHLLFLVTAVLFWAQLIPSRPLRRRLSLAQQAVFLVAAAAAQEALDLVFVLAPEPLYRFYVAVPRWPGAPSPLADQSIAAGVMEIVGMTALGIGFVLLVRQPHDRIGRPGGGVHAQSASHQPTGSRVLEPTHANCLENDPGLTASIFECTSTRWKTRCGKGTPPPRVTPRLLM